MKKKIFGNLFRKRKWDFESLYSEPIPTAPSQSNEMIEHVLRIEGVEKAFFDGVGIRYCGVDFIIEFEYRKDEGFKIINAPHTFCKNRYHIDTNDKNFGMFREQLLNGNIKTEKDIRKYASRGWIELDYKMFEANSSHGTNFNVKKTMDITKFTD